MSRNLFTNTKYYIYTSAAGRSSYLFKTNNKKRKFPRKSDCYYGLVIKVLKGASGKYISEGYGSWPSVHRCRPITEVETVTYKLLGYI